jgi:chemotaxis protein histidine kinase CheA
MQVDTALMQMFAAEVETHMAALNDGVLALEQNPDQSEQFEALMRAAHSIKGAAKLVGLEAAVEIAHVIEDCFVAARTGRLVMTSGLVDVLLEGVDLLGRAAQFDMPPELRVTKSQVSATVNRISQATSEAPVARTAELQLAKAATPDVRSTEPRCQEFSPPRALDANWVNENQREMAALLKQGRTVALDLANLTQIDPLGLALLGHVARSAHPRECPLLLRNVPVQFMPLLQAAGLQRLCSASEQKV